MPVFDANQAECHVFTFKEGALSALAHDLELRVGRFTIDVAADLAIDARFAADSLTVVHPLKDGRPSDALSDGDKRKIEKTIGNDVLDLRRHPEITFRAPAPTRSGDGFVIAGQLTLQGKTRPVEVRSHAVGTTQVAEIVLHQPDYGIKPFSAMLGTLRIRPDVKIRVTIPWQPSA
jgi:hypothetical protein